MHSLRPELAGQALRNSAHGPLTRGKGGEVGAALDGGGGTGVDEGRRVRGFADGGNEEGEDGVREEEGTTAEEEMGVRSFERCRGWRS